MKRLLWAYFSESGLFKSTHVFYVVQTELLAPILVKAAQERVAKPDDAAVVENYKKLLAQYVESMSRVRDLCDQAVDPMDFVQTAGKFF